MKEIWVMFFYKKNEEKKTIMGVRGPGESLSPLDMAVCSSKLDDFFIFSWVRMSVDL
jgi:hypothetical protein